MYHLCPFWPQMDELRWKILWYLAWRSITYSIRACCLLEIECLKTINSLTFWRTEENVQLRLTKDDQSTSKSNLPFLKSNLISLSFYSFMSPYFFLFLSASKLGVNSMIESLLAYLSAALVPSIKWCFKAIWNSIPAFFLLII